MIAMSLTLGDPQRVGNFVRPGSEVVVFDTHVPPAENGPGTNTDQGAAPQPLTTRVLLDRVLVIAVGESTTTTPTTNPDGTTAAAVPSALLTVAVDQTQAQTLIHALATGSLYLGLLGEGTEIVKSNGVTDANLFD